MCLLACDGHISNKHCDFIEDYKSNNFCGNMLMLFSNANVCNCVQQGNLSIYFIPSKLQHRIIKSSWGSVEES